MTKILTNALHIIALCMIFTAFGGATAECQILSVSVTNLSLSKGERVIGLELHVRSGRIVLLPNIPIGWNITVDNDPSWDATVKGSIEVGGAATDADFLQDFIVIEEEPDASLDAPFNLSGEVIVTTDFKTEKRIKLAMKDFETKGASPSTAAKRPQ